MLIEIERVPRRISDGTEKGQTLFDGLVLSFGRLGGLLVS